MTRLILKTHYILIISIAARYACPTGGFNWIMTKNKLRKPVDRDSRSIFHLELGTVKVNVKVNMKVNMKSEMGMIYLFQIYQNLVNTLAAL